MVGSESGGWHRGREFFTEKSSPFPPTKKREMPCRVKVVADCTALRRVQWGNIFKAWRPDNHNGLGRRIRTRLVGFFSSFSCGAVKHRPALVPSGGSFFIPGQRSASSPPKRERERVSVAKGVEKNNGERYFTFVLGREKNNQILLLHYSALGA